jgi:hypothetical protein
MVDLLFGVVCLVIVVIVFTARPRRERAIKRGREQLLQALAPVVSGSLSDALHLTGTYKGHPVEASLRSSGRIDSLGGHSAASDIEVITINLRGAPGGHPWGFYSSLVNRTPLMKKWRSTTVSAGAIGQFLSRLTPMPIDPAIDDRLRDGGMLERFERLEPPHVKRPYVLVSYVPDGAAVIEHTLERVDAVRPGAFGGDARRTAAEWLAREQGGHLRVEIERGGSNEPTPERFREILDAAIAIAQLNAIINPPTERSL